MIAIVPAMAAVIVERGAGPLAAGGRARARQRA
jgi:hypothetical protein